MGPLAAAVGVRETLFGAAALVAAALGAAAAAPSVRSLGAHDDRLGGFVLGDRVEGGAYRVLSLSTRLHVQAAVGAIDVDADHVPPRASWHAE